MRIMAFDYGTKRIGVAVTDPLQIIASPLRTVHPLEVWTFIEDYLKTEQVETFVVGLPRQTDGSPSPSAQHVVGFVRKLKKTYPQISVVEVDERFTSKMAERSLKDVSYTKTRSNQKEVVDQIAATFILQSFLEQSK